MRGSTPPDKPLLSYADVARVLRWNRAKASRWVRAGMIPSVVDPDSGRRWVRRAELELWLAGRNERGAA